MAATQDTATTVGPVVGPDTALPGSEQLAPYLLGALGLLALAVAVVSLVRRRRRARRDAGPPRRPTTAVVAGGTAALLLGGALLTLPPSFSVPEFPALPRLLPDEAFFYRSVTDLPVAAESADWIASQGGAPLVPGFSGEVVGGVVDGVPFNPTTASTPLVEVRAMLAPDTSPRSPYPMADPAYVESMPLYTYDNHYVAVDVAAGRMWELIGLRKWFWRWEADAGALWDLDSLAYPAGSTTASGLPLLPGTLTYDEVASGEVGHVALLTGPTTRSGEFVWPARGTDGRVGAPGTMPQGAWLRLRADADLSGLGPQARTVAAGLQRFGAVMSDTGPNWALRGTPDARWDNADLATLRTLSADDFEVVDTGGVVVARDSMEARPPA